MLVDRTQEPHWLAGVGAAGGGVAATAGGAGATNAADDVVGAIAEAGVVAAVAETVLVGALADIGARKYIGAPGVDGARDTTSGALRPADVGVIAGPGTAGG